MFAIAELCAAQGPGGGLFVGRISCNNQPVGGAAAACEGSVGGGNTLVGVTPSQLGVWRELPQYHVTKQVLPSADSNEKTLKENPSLPLTDSRELRVTSGRDRQAQAVDARPGCPAAGHPLHPQDPRIWPQCRQESGLSTAGSELCPPGRSPRPRDGAGKAAGGPRPGMGTGEGPCTVCLVLTVTSLPRCGGRGSERALRRPATPSSTLAPTLSPLLGRTRVPGPAAQRTALSSGPQFARAQQCPGQRPRLDTQGPNM